MAISTGLILNRYFWEHSSGEMSTTSWRPGRTYPDDVQKALIILSRYRPNSVQYLISNGVPILLEAPHSLHEPDAAHTDEATGTIHLKATRGITTADYAALIFHESIHVQYGDPRYSFYYRSRWARFFLRHEEADGHLRMLTLLHDMSGTYPNIYKLADPVFLQYFLYFWPLGTVLGFVSIAFGCIWLGEFMRRRQRQIMRKGDIG